MRIMAVGQSRVNMCRRHNGDFGLSTVMVGLAFTFLVASGSQVFSSQSERRCENRLVRHRSARRTRIMGVEVRVGT